MGRLLLIVVTILGLGLGIFIFLNREEIKEAVRESARSQEA